MNRTAIQPRTLGELTAGHRTAEIVNLLGNNVVRKLTVSEDRTKVTIDFMAPGQVVEFSRDALIHYDPWAMDRGSLMLECDKAPRGEAKLCVEMDLIRYEDGTEAEINPHPEAPKMSHEARLTYHDSKEGPVTYAGRSMPHAAGEIQLTGVVIVDFHGKAKPSGFPVEFSARWDGKKVIFEGDWSDLPNMPAAIEPTKQQVNEWARQHGSDLQG